MKCLRVIDEEGKVVNDGGFEKYIEDEKLKKMFGKMVEMNEVDKLFLMAHR